MSIRRTVVSVLLVASSVIQAAGIGMVGQGTTSFDAAHGSIDHHACCLPVLEHPRVPLVPWSPSSSHRCCFLRGRQSSLPVRSAEQKRVFAAILNLETKRLLPAPQDPAITPFESDLVPLSMKQSMVLRN